MTRKDYIKIAAILDEARRLSFDRLGKINEFDKTNAISLSMADMLAVDNPQSHGKP